MSGAVAVCLSCKRTVVLVAIDGAQVACDPELIAAVPRPSTSPIAATRLQAYRVHAESCERHQLEDKRLATHARQRRAQLGRDPRVVQATADRRPSSEAAAAPGLMVTAADSVIEAYESHVSAFRGVIARPEIAADAQDLEALLVDMVEGLRRFDVWVHGRGAVIIQLAESALAKIRGLS